MNTVVLTNDNSSVILLSTIDAVITQDFNEQTFVQTSTPIID